MTGNIDIHYECYTIGDVPYEECLTLVLTPCLCHHCHRTVWDGRLRRCQGKLQTSWMTKLQ